MKNMEHKVLLIQMLIDGTFDYINILLIEFHNHKIDISTKKDDIIIKTCKEKNIKIITEDMIDNGNDPHGNWFKLI